MTVFRKFLLTFDVEDFINSNEIHALHGILEILKKYKLKAIFFITGHMAEKISNFPEVINLLKNHEIGYHSSSHSVRPLIPEYTDVPSYKKAYEISLKRETSHINPLTGKIESEGGIYFLQDLFNSKKIEAYRAPGMSWAPPHLEALADLGIKFDFSSSMTISEPVCYKNITFYPETFIQQWEGTRSDYQCLFSSLLKRRISVFDLHPTLYVNREMWDSIYYRGNPHILHSVRRRPVDEAKSLFKKFELFIKYINFLRDAKLIDENPSLSTTGKYLTVNENIVQKCYTGAIEWPKKFFNYSPRFILTHFYEFFEI